MLAYFLFQGAAYFRNKLGNPNPGWQDSAKTRDLFQQIQKGKPISVYI
jgi:hypothetical protein